MEDEIKVVMLALNGGTTKKGNANAGDDNYSTVPIKTAKSRDRREAISCLQ